MTAIPATSSPDERARLSLTVAAVVTLVVAAYCWSRLGRGWVPHDEGTIAQSAERVLRGDVPHHDFIDVYTGGLSYLHALAMRVFGLDLLAPRKAIFLLLLAWVPALYYCFCRFLGPLAAGGMTLLAAMWSFPAYPAALPSWYILFLATFGIAALLHFIDHPRRTWLVLAGIAAGLTVLAKVSGLFFIAAVSLFLVYREQDGAAHKGSDTTNAPSRAWLGVLAIGLALFVTALAMLVRHRANAGVEFHFVLPSLVLGGMMLVTEWRAPRGNLSQRMGGVLRTWLPFMGGVAIPLGILAAGYALRGQLGELLYGVFVLPSRRVQFAAVRPPGPATLLAALPLLALVVPWPLLERRRLVVNVVLLAAGLLALLFAATSSPWLYGRTWLSVRSLAPVAVLAGTVMLLRRRPGVAGDPGQRQRTVLLLWTMALMSFVQFPFAAPIYYCYIAPFVALAIVAIRPVNPTVPRAVPALVAGFYIAFAIWLVHPGTVFTFGQNYEADQQTEMLRLPRAGLKVTYDDQQLYERLIPLVEEHAQNGVLLALPDAPEVSFLAGRANPTRALFEFFEEPMSADSLLALARARGVTSVVINTRPAFSPVVSPAVLAALRARYPSEQQVGHFLVLW